MPSLSMERNRKGWSPTATTPARLSKEEPKDKEAGMVLHAEGESFDDGDDDRGLFRCKEWEQRSRGAVVTMPREEGDGNGDGGGLVAS